MTPDEAIKVWGDKIEEYKNILKNEFGLTVRINRNRDKTSSYIKNFKGDPIYDIDELLEIYDENGNLINNRKGQFIKPVSEEAQNIIYEIWDLRNRLHTLLKKHGIDLFETKKTMLSKNTFKKLIEQCIAEVAVEPDSPHEKWNDTFGNKMPGEFTVESKEETWTDMMNRVEREYNAAIRDPDKRYFNYKRSYSEDPKTPSSEQKPLKKFIKECVLEVLAEDLSEDLSEGFDPQSNAGPNIQSTEGTSEYNPYPAWNSRMRKLEETDPGSGPDPKFMKGNKISSGVTKNDMKKYTGYFKFKSPLMGGKRDYGTVLLKDGNIISITIGGPNISKSQKINLTDANDMWNSGWSLFDSIVAGIKSNEEDPSDLNETNHSRAKCHQCGKHQVVTYKDSSAMCKACGWKRAPDRPRIVCPECGKQQVIKYNDGSYLCKSCGYKKSFKIRESEGNDPVYYTEYGITYCHFDPKKDKCPVGMKVFSYKLNHVPLNTVHPRHICCYNSNEFNTLIQHWGRNSNWKFLPDASTV